MKHRLIVEMLISVAVVGLAQAAGATARGRSPAKSEPARLGYQEEEGEERFSRRFEVGSEGSLELSNVSGQIVVRGASGGEIQIDAVKRAPGHGEEGRRQLEALEIDVTHTGSRVRVSTRYGEWHGRHRDSDSHASVDYQVSVPYGTDVTLTSVSGDVDVQNVRGELQAESVSGEVSVAKAENLVLAKSVSGDVQVVSASGSGSVEVASVSGKVGIQGIRASEVHVSSVSGDMTVTDASCDRVSFETVSGEIRFTGTLARSGRYEFKSHSGDVDVTVPGDVGFELEAESFSGDIESDFPLTTTSSRGRRREVSGVYGNGSAFIEATTFSGNVILKKR